MRKLKQLKRSKQTVNTLNLILSDHEDLRNCYFWKPPGNASCRRRYEENHSQSITFSLNDVIYEIHQKTDCSCKNIYYSLSVFVDGEKKDVRAIKKLLR